MGKNSGHLGATGHSKILPGWRRGEEGSAPSLVASLSPGTWPSLTFCLKRLERYFFVVLGQCSAFEEAAWGQSSIVIPSGFQLSVIKLLKYVCF